MTDNRLMPWLQAVVAIIIVTLFCVIAVGPMVGLQPADLSSSKTLENVLLILVGFLFGTSVSGAKKDDTI